MPETKTLIIEGLEFEDLMKIVKVACKVPFSCISVKYENPSTRGD